MIDDDLKNVDKTICDNIELINSLKADRALIAQNLLGQSRNLVEHIAVKIYAKAEGEDLSVGWETIKKALEFIKHNNKYLFLRTFHSFLQESKSHYTPNHDGAERLLLKYYKFFTQIRFFMRKEFDVEMLHNLDLFPINTDATTQEYHDKIAELLTTPRMVRSGEYSQRMYVHKVNPFVANQSVYYEVVLSPAYDTTSKFERFVCYSPVQIPSYYAIKADICSCVIYIKNTRMPISILLSYKVSIRPCEIKNFSRIFGLDIRVKTSSSEYNRMMNYLTCSGMSLKEVVDLSEKEYLRVKTVIFDNDQSNAIAQMLDCCRKLIVENLPGANVISYLLHTMNNKIIKKQLHREPVNKLSNLYLQWKCIPFDTMPYASSLVGHNPISSYLFSSVSSENRECEFVARAILRNMNDKSIIYTPIDDVLSNCSKDVDSLVREFNDLLYSGHRGRRIEKFGKNLYQRDAFDNTKIIVSKLLEMSNDHPKGFEIAIRNWLENTALVDCSEKKNILLNLFKNSHVSVIYGAAGTGKTYIVNLISQFLINHDKLFLANTNPAVENLRRKITAQNCTFMTISKFLNSTSIKVEYTTLIIDECSMVSNHDMRKILDKAKFKLLILIGDTYQIESIDFGNWFAFIKYFLPYQVCNELKTTYRTDVPELLELWNKVRTVEGDITEYIVSHNYVSKLDPSIFTKFSDDEIILCLNYDGFYGINNVNRFLQENNQNTAVKWGVWTFKIGDPILFNETERFMPTLYNNLKGKIVNIENDDVANCIWFSIEVDKALTEFDMVNGLELLDCQNIGKSIVRFKVSKIKDSDIDNDFVDDSDIPFQLAYAISIHKAQGLEYDSVKVVITQEVDEMISHNIFYTAITRAKKYLKIYMSPESQEKIISGFNELSCIKNDVKIFSAHSQLKLRKIK